MAPQFVKPYVKSNKNDAADAEAICDCSTASRLARSTEGATSESALIAASKGISLRSDMRPVVMSNPCPVCIRSDHQLHRMHHV
jgi:hypothetical protein